MPRKENYCVECDNSFVITYKGADPVISCPFCSAELPQEESIDFEDDAD